MKTSIALGSLLLLTPGLVAQISVRSSLNAAGNFGLFAAQGTNVDHANIAAGRAIPTSATISATIRGTGGISSIIGWRQNGNVVSMDLSEQGALTVPRGMAFRGGSTSSALGGRIVPGPHALMLTIKGKPGSLGLVETWAAGVTGDGVGVKYAVDVANDGTTDFAAAPPRGSSKIIPVRMPASGILRIRVTSVVAVARAAGTSARFKTGVSVRYTPGPHCAIRSYGESCGPRLAGRYAPASAGGGALVLAASNGTAGGPALMLLGLRELHLRLPFSRCPLLNDARWVVPFRFDRSGNAVFPFRLAPGTMGDVKVQVAELRRTHVLASNGVQVVCVK